MNPQPVDLLLHNGIVLTMNGRGDLYPDGAVAIHGDTIVAVGEAGTLRAQYRPARTLDCGGGVISPGLVNAHTHVPMTLLRGLSDDLRLDVWLYGFMMPVEREFVTPDFSYTGTLLACAEMIRAGITTFCDMYYFEDQVARAAAKAGMRAVCAQTILKFPAPDAPSYDDSLQYTRLFIEKWKNHPLIVPAVGPHAPYTATPEMLRACVEIATHYDVPLHIHVAETTLEQEGSKAEYGVPVVPWLEGHNLFRAKVIAAHCVHLDETEMHTLQTAGAGVAHCPSSNLKLASGVAPVHKMLQLGLKVGIGTDGTASNNDLDMFEETRLAAFLQKGVFADPTLLPARRAWELATIGGARAIHLDHLTGSLEPGKRADVIVVDMQATHQTPHFRHNPDAVYAQLVYAAKSTDVRHVFINGQPVMEDRTLQTLDEEALQHKARTIARKIDVFLTHREGDLLSKLLAVGSGVEPIETYEAQIKVKIDSVEQIEPQLEQEAITITRSSIRNQYDTYFLFEREELGRIRYREDEVLNKDGSVKEVLYRTSLIGPAVERVFDNSTLVTRSRYSLPADKSRRFYREYFQPSREIQVEKHRKRYHIEYKGTPFALNLDTLANGDTYMEIKTRTWSARDAEVKAEMLGELLEVFQVNMPENLVRAEYQDLV
ncbi:MAG: amidohydrolase [Caldilineae bacterium]|nr:MAG: amidohydrolase [Caldilineae bacterium]